MPVERFRSIDAMNDAPPRVGAAPDVERFFRHCARYWRLAPRVYPRGVFKFRSVQEADRFSATHHRLRDTSRAR